MIPGETIASGASPICCDEKLVFQVLHSMAGYYIGTQCDICGPYSRESNYFSTNNAAKAALNSGIWGR